MIVNHKWTCTKCDTKLFLAVDDQSNFDMGKLVAFESHITKHVILSGHEVIHKTKGEFKVKYV